MGHELAHNSCNVYVLCTSEDNIYYYYSPAFKLNFMTKQSPERMPEDSGGMTNGSI